MSMKNKPTNDYKNFPVIFGGDVLCKILKLLSVEAQEANDRTRTACMLCFVKKGKKLVIESMGHNWVEWALPLKFQDKVFHPSLYWNDSEFRNSPQHQFFHAEQEALHNLSPTAESNICFTLFDPCEDCAEQLLQHGIEHVIFFKHHKSYWNTPRQQRLVKKFLTYSYINPTSLGFERDWILEVTGELNNGE